MWPWSSCALRPEGPVRREQEEKPADEAIPSRLRVPADRSCQRFCSWRSSFDIHSVRSGAYQIPTCMPPPRRDARTSTRFLVTGSRRQVRWTVSRHPVRRPRGAIGLAPEPAGACALFPLEPARPESRRRLLRDALRQGHRRWRPSATRWTACCSPPSSPSSPASPPAPSPPGRLGLMQVRPRAGRGLRREAISSTPTSTWRWAAAT